MRVTHRVITVTLHIHMMHRAQRQCQASPMDINVIRHIRSDPFKQILVFINTDIYHLYMLCIRYESISNTIESCDFLL